MEVAWDKVITWDLKSGDVSELQRLTKLEQFWNKHMPFTEQQAVPMPALGFQSVAL